MSGKAFGNVGTAREGSSQTCFSMSALATRSKDTQAAVLSLGMLNEGYRSRETEENGGGRSVKEVEDRASLAPETPQRAPRPTPGTPLTPLANLKVLIAAASSALERECASGGRGGDGVDGGGTGDDCGGRKMKSLSVLCQRFLTIAENEVGVGNDFSLELMSQNLGTNRRRIYDILNVLEALEMIVKQSKNWYTWMGKENLLLTLAKMRAMAQDDPDFRHLHSNENSLPTSSKPSEVNHSCLALSDKTNLPLHTSLSMKKSSKPTDHDQLPCSDGTPSQSSSCHHDPQQPVVECDESMPSVCGACGGNGNGGRWDKSLGVLCQKFVMLFLVTPKHEVTLDYAGNMLMPDCVDSMGNPFAAMHQPTNPKTKVRRLYDIANVLTTLGLIKKKSFLAPNHRKMPGYAWAGPSMEEIQAIPVFRKNEFNLYPFYSKKKGNGPAVGGVALTRKASVGSGAGGVRPFLHQYEVKGHESSSNGKPDSCDGGKHSSAPSSPVKSRVVRRTLSFGAQPSKSSSKRTHRPSSLSSNLSSSSNCMKHSAPFVPIAPAPAPAPPSNSSKCVVARPLAPKQVDYMNEVKEFEAEMRKHSHKFPHVASVFQEFIQKYQSTLEQAASAGRTILPKAIPLIDNTSVGSSVSQSLSNPQIFNAPSHAPSAMEVAVNIYNATGNAPPPTSSSFGNRFALNSLLEVQPSSNSGNCTSAVTNPQAGTVTLTSQPTALIQLGDIDINGVAKPEMMPCPPVPLGCQSPAPTLNSGTHGVLKSPGPTGATAFMSVEDVMVPSPNPAKGTQTSSNCFGSVPSSSSKSTVLTALLKGGTTTSNEVPPQPPPSAVTSNVTAQNNAVQQALVSTLLNSLVNQSPIPTPTALNKSEATAPSSKPGPVLDTNGCTFNAVKVSPHITQPMQLPRAISLANAFNPSMFLSNPAHLAQQQLFSAAAASTGTILPANALLPNMTLSPYLASFPAIYGNGFAQTPPTFTSTDPSAVRNLSVSASVPLPASITKEKSSEDSGPSPPKKPRLQ